MAVSATTAPAAGDAASVRARFLGGDTSAAFAASAASTFAASAASAFVASAASAFVASA
jgi:hypothetical protein